MYLSIQLIKKKNITMIETAEKNGFEKTLVDKKIIAQKKLKNIKNNTTLETFNQNGHHLQKNSSTRN